MPTDGELKTAVTEELAWLANVNSTKIGVAVDRGAVTLTGEVETYPERRSAEEAALRVRGVTAIAEEITVRSPKTRVNDTDIAREVGEALARAVDVPLGEVKATVHNHAITLEGHLPWHYQKQAAGRAVQYLKGVTDVHNQIVIKPTVSSSGVKAAITAALVRDARFQGERVTVEADSVGVVTLTGTVHSWSERQAAQDAAWFAPGVQDVVNELRLVS